MANTFYAKQLNVSKDFLPEMARFLVNDLATFTGPAWTIIDTYSSGAGTPHEIPGTATDMDSLAADNGWRTGTLVVGDYIILQSASASNKFQVGIEYHATNPMRFITAPTGGFVTGNDDNDMTAAGNWGNPKLTTFDFTTPNNLIASWSVIADADHFKLICENHPTYYFTYIGKLDEVHTGDNNPVVQWFQEASAYHYLTGAYLQCLQRSDGTTTQSLYPCDITGAGNNDFALENLMYNPANNTFPIFPIYLHSGVATDKGVRGKLKGTYFTCNSLAGKGKGTFGNKDYAYINAADTTPALIFDWDGETDL